MRGKSYCLFIYFFISHFLANFFVLKKLFSIFLNFWSLSLICKIIVLVSIWIADFKQLFNTAKIAWNYFKFSKGQESFFFHPPNIDIVINKCGYWLHCSAVVNVDMKNGCWWWWCIFKSTTPTTTAAKLISYECKSSTSNSKSFAKHFKTFIHRWEQYSGMDNFA